MKFPNLIKESLLRSDLEGFSQKTVLLAGEECVLVTPKKAGAIWNKHNLCLRSVIFRKEDLSPVSLGFPKFFNWGESLDLTYIPFSTKANGGIEVLEKRDGSLLIVSKYKGELIHRTRGTSNAEDLENGFEIQELKEQFPSAFELEGDTCPYSLLFEWESTVNQIVIKHDKLNLVLIGAVNHEDYSLWTQTELDEFAVAKGLCRPERFHFDSIKQMIDDVTLWVGKEGVVTYSQKGQSLLKIKADDYLRIHRLKSELASIKHVVDFYVSAGTPPLKEAYTLIETTISFEVAERCKEDLEKVHKAWGRVNHLIDKLEIELLEIYGEDRKTQALWIQDRIDSACRGLAFSILHKKELDEKSKTKHIKYELSL